MSRIEENKTDDKAITITLDQIRTLRDGLCVWNTVTVDSLTDRGRIKLFAAQDLIERIWNESSK